MNIDSIITVLFFVVTVFALYCMTKAIKDEDLHTLIFAGFIINAVAVLFVGYQLNFIML